MLRLAEESFAIDPRNYHFWALAADDAWNARAAAPTREEDARLRAAAELWCGRALKENPWHPKARVLWANILAERDPAEALRYWQGCVEWQYWEPFNHALLAELLARTGDFAAASNTLSRIQGRPYCEETRRLIDRMASGQKSP